MKAVFCFFCILLVGCSSSMDEYTLTNATPNGVEVTGGFCGYDTMRCINDMKTRGYLHCKSYGKAHKFIGKGPNEGLLFECIETLQNQSSPQSSLSVALSSVPAKTARGEYTNCLRANIIALDDLQSDASTIASAIAYACSAKYTRYVSEVLSQVNLFEGAKNKLRASFKSVEVQKVIPYVLAWRQVVRQGFSKSQKPSEKELPNNLYQADLEVSL